MPKSERERERERGREGEGETSLGWRIGNTTPIPDLDQARDARRKKREGSTPPDTSAVIL